MLTLAESRALLNRDGYHYSDEEIEQIRSLIHTLVSIDLDLYQRRMERKLPSTTPTPVISLKPETDEEKSHPLPPGQYRRAG